MLESPESSRCQNSVVTLWIGVHLIRVREIILEIGWSAADLGKVNHLIHTEQFNARKGMGFVVKQSLRYVLLPLETVMLTTLNVNLTNFALGINMFIGDLRGNARIENGTQELACGSQEFISTLLFDSSMSALPILSSQQGKRVRLFIY